MNRLLLAVLLLGCTSPDPVEEIPTALGAITYSSPWGNATPVNAYVGINNGTHYVAFRNPATGQCVFNVAGGALGLARNTTVNLTAAADSLEIAAGGGPDVVAWCYSWFPTGYAWIPYHLIRPGHPPGYGDLTVRAGAGDDFIQCNGETTCYGDDGNDYLETDVRWEFRGQDRTSMYGGPGNDRLRILSVDQPGVGASSSTVVLDGGGGQDCLEAPGPPADHAQLDCGPDLDWTATGSGVNRYGIGCEYEAPNCQ